MDCVVEATLEQSGGQEPRPFAVQAAGWDFLADRRHNETSQFGEDGLIAAVFERIGTTNEWCFEVGAADGEWFSNTKRLRDAGWRAVLIEANPLQADKCRKWENSRVQVVEKKIAHNSLDGILSTAAAPIQLDLGIIDIDGQDYWAWDGLKMYRPRVMLVEFMYALPDPWFVPECGGPGQAGPEAIAELGLQKGYTPLAATYCNILFVDSQCL